MAAVRYKWMFRAAAIVFLALGAAWLWTFGLTDYRPQHRPYGLAAGVSALLLGVFLFRRARVAIGMSAVLAAFISICAAVFAPNARGPGILFLAVFALLFGTYAVLAARVIFSQPRRQTPGE